MAADAELSRLPVRRLHARLRIFAPEACAALLVVVSGTIGLIAHSGLREMVEAWINIHVLFGLLLCGWIMIRCQRLVSRSPLMCPADVRGLARPLSRIVYCVLYGVIVLKQSLSIGSALWHGGTVDFSLFDASLRQGPDTRIFHIHDDFQMFLASALVPLVIVRAVAFELWARLIGRSGL